MVINLARRVSMTVGALAFAMVLPGVVLADMQPAFSLESQRTVVAAQPAALSSVEQLKLSDQQKRTLRALRKARNQEISKVLSDAQRKNLVQALKSGTKLAPALQALNLSADQKQKIGTIVQKSNQQVKATLTPQQQEQLETMRKQHQTTAQTPIE